jgi:hypothetical protein
VTETDIIHARVRGHTQTQERERLKFNLFPYTLGRIYKENDHVVINYHERTLCPHKKDLLMQDKEIRKLILSFAHEAFGNKHIIEVKKEGLLAKLMIKLKHKLLL